MEEIINLYPKFVLNSKGEKEPFTPELLARDLNKETGLDMKIANNITNEVVRDLIALNSKEPIRTKYIRELICLKLTERQLDKHRNLFARAFVHDRILFKLDESFLSKFKDKQPDWGPLGYVTFKRTYARNIEKENRKEEFWETTKRCVEGCYSIQKEHCIRHSLPWKDDKAQKSAKVMFEKIWNFKFLPPGRGLWMMGTEFIARQGSMALNNCGFVSTENIDLTLTKPFEFVMDALMLGVGVGFDVLGANKITIKEPEFSLEVFSIPDSREGWVEGLKKIIEGYFLGKEIPYFVFDKIRKAGLPIRGFGGISSGPEPLNDLYTFVFKLLKTRVGSILTSTDILDIMNNIAKCVVAGNVRRSAEIALGLPDDHPFVFAKYDKEKLKSHRWASNNSIFCKRGDDYSLISRSLQDNGEPGIVWLENIKNYSRMCEKPDYKDIMARGVNPCGEQALESFELCCLCETFPSRHETYEEFQDTLKYAYLYPKTVTLLNTHWEETNQVMLKNRRIGISQTGIIEAFIKHGRRTVLDWCDRGYKYLKELDEIYSDWLCVPKSKKMTTVKPSGSVSLLPGVTPGIHYPHSLYYIRRIRFAETSDLIPILKNAGYDVFTDEYSPKTVVVEFPIMEKWYDRCKTDVSMWEQAQNAADYQRYWSDNNVSITITFKKEEAIDIVNLLESFEDKLKAVSFLPVDQKCYSQAPYEEITKEEYEEKIAKTKPLLQLDTVDRTEGVLFCDGDSCEV